jgi:hypothetical protein
MANHYISINLNAAGGSDDRRVKVSTDDSLPGFLEEKIEAGSTKVVVTTRTPGGAEILDVDVDETQIDHDNLLNHEVDQHRVHDDTTTTTTSLWSSQKIQDELDTKINAATPMTDNKLVKSIGTSGVDVEATGIDVDDSNNITGINDLTIDGDLTVNGTTTSVNSDTLDVTDANITVNNGGTQASADAGNAGLTIEMSDATDVEIGYDSTTASKMALGEIGSQSEIITATHTQTLSNKTLDADNNTISNLEVDNLKAGVLSTDLDAAVDNNNIAGAQAIKDYVAARVAEKDDASEITYTPADGTDYDVVPTHVDGALDELASRTNTVEDNLTAHLNADPAKHAAAQITNVAAGNIAATTVQGAINELDTEKYIAASFDGDFDTRLATKDTDNLVESATNKYASPAQLDKVDFITVTQAVDLDDVETKALSALQNGDNISELVNDSVFVDAAGAQTAAVVNSTAGSETVQAPSVAAMKAYVGQSAGDILETSFTVVNNITTLTDITGFAFANGSVRSFEAQVSIDRGGDSLYEKFDIEGIQKAGSWEISVESVGDDSGVEFDIDATGQVQYTTSNLTSGGTLKFRSITTSN